MAAVQDMALEAQIALVEKRMALRRERMVDGLAQTRAEASRLTSRATRYLPAAGALAALAVGFAVARHRRTSTPPAQAFRAAPAPVATPAAKGLLATLVAVAAGTIRFATSAEGRMVWQAFKTARARAQR